MSHTAPSFLLLPAKIRNQIYNYVWSDETVTFTLTHRQFLHPIDDSSEILATEDSSSDEDVEEDFYRKVRCKGSILKDGPLVFIHTRTHFRPSTQTGIRGTCRQIYKETVAVFYGRSYFFYNLWESLPTHMRDPRPKGDSAAPAKPTLWHLYEAKKPEVPIQYLGLMRELHLVLAYRPWHYLMSPQLIVRALSRFSMAKVLLERLVLEFRFNKSSEDPYEEFDLQLPPHPVQSHDPDREHWEPLWARFCRDQSIAKVISDTTISKEIQVELMEWDRSTADSFEHFVRSITATKGWVCDKKRDEARMYNPDGHYREGAFERCKQHVRSFTTTKRLVYDKERKEARLRSVGKIKKGEDNTFYWCWRLRPGKIPSPQPAHGLLPEPDLSTLSLTEEGSTRENDSTSDWRPSPHEQCYSACSGTSSKPASEVSRLLTVLGASTCPSLSYPRHQIVRILHDGGSFFGRCTFHGFKHERSKLLHF